MTDCRYAENFSERLLNIKISLFFIIFIAFQITDTILSFFNESGFSLEINV